VPDVSEPSRDGHLGCEGCVLGSCQEKWERLFAITDTDVSHCRCQLESVAHIANGVRHRDFEQVEKDVARSFVSALFREFVPNDTVRTAYRIRLARIVHSLMQAHEAHLYYFQGLHDVASVIMVGTNDDALALAILHKLSETFLSVNMQKDLSPVLDSLSLLYPLLRFIDQAVLVNHFEEAQMAPFFMVPWVLTWFSHDCEDISCVLFVYDQIFLHHPLYIVYLSAFVVAYYSDIILNSPSKSCSSELHQFIQGLPGRQDFAMAVIYAASRASDFIDILTPSVLLSCCGLQSSIYARLCGVDDVQDDDSGRVILSRKSVSVTARLSQLALCAFSIGLSAASVYVLNASQ
jgi:hypothetical protein